MQLYSFIINLSSRALHGLTASYNKEERFKLQIL